MTQLAPTLDHNLCKFLKSFQDYWTAELRLLKIAVSIHTDPLDTDALMEGMRAICSKKFEAVEQIRSLGGLLFAFEGSTAHEGVAA